MIINGLDKQGFEQVGEEILQVLIKHRVQHCEVKEIFEGVEGAISLSVISNETLPVVR